MTAICALGVDPGPVPGFFLAAWSPGEREAAWTRAYQCNAGGAEGLLIMLLGMMEGTQRILDYGPVTACGQIEEFRTRSGAGSTGRNASVTREQVVTLGALAAERGVRLAVRHSSAVFPWCSDKRLQAAGLREATTGLVHARAASRHCLFAAVRDGGLPDPLSTRAVPG